MRSTNGLRISTISMSSRPDSNQRRELFKNENQHLEKGIDNKSNQYVRVENFDLRDTINLQDQYE